MEETKLLSTQEISQHNSPEDCWLVIEDGVWDCSDFVNDHPGGSALILKFAGRGESVKAEDVQPVSIFLKDTTSTMGALRARNWLETWGWLVLVWGGKN